MADMEIADLEAEIRAQRDVALVVNALSRRGARFYQQALQQLEQRGFRVTAAYRVRDPSLLLAATRDAIQHGARLILVGGGDGTITTVAAAFAYQHVALGLLPMGTGNSFARSLDIPLMLPAALDVLEHGRLTDVDLGCADGIYFVNAADMGISATVARLTPHALKQWFGIFAYVITGAYVLATHRPVCCTFRHQDARHMCHVYEVIVANGRSFGGTMLSDPATLQRHLVVTFMAKESRWDLLRLWVPFLLRRPRLDEMQQFVTTEFTLETDSPQYIELDGEFSLQTPVHFAVAPKALKVFVPRQDA